ncbi:MAG: hypothetical protein HUU55_10965 [Myxococcales bacterium]|nr:hypothetical protein [Myxococcales bacterium]
MWTGAGVAIRTQFQTLAATRGTRALFYGSIVGIGAVLVGVLAGQLPAHTITDLRVFALIPGVAVTSVLVAEVPIRDGLSRRTLLHLLLGPVDRFVLAIVRTLLCSVLVFVFLGAVQLTLALAAGLGVDVTLRELLACLLGSLAYMSVFSLVHLYTKHGLVTGLIVYLAADHFIGQVPFALRQIALSAHVANIAGHEHAITIGGLLATENMSITGSIVLLVVVAVLCFGLMARAFSKRDLAELC